MSWTSDDETPMMENIDDTLSLLGTQMAVIHEAILNPPISGASREAIEKKHDQLEAHSDALMVHRDNLKAALKPIWAELAQIRVAKDEFKRIDILPDALILFVDVIEKANQYFEFQICAKEKYNFKLLDFKYPREICDILLHDEQLNLKFNKLGQNEIQHAGQKISRELADEHRGRVGDNQSKDYALSDWIFNLVFQAREKGYIMDQSPMVELQKMKSAPEYVYDKYFIWHQQPEKSTKSLTEKAHSKYSQFLMDVKAYTDSKQPQR